MATLNDDYLKYPERSYGMDHDRYEWSMLQNRKAVEWPNEKKIALWVNVGLQFFPLNQKGIPFKVPGGMTKPYPDLRHYSLRDYGNRVGIYRFLKAFDNYDITPTFAMNTRLAERIPYLANTIIERGDEIMCHGFDMDKLHYGGQDPSEEKELIKMSLDRLRNLTGQDITGWISPAKNESENTPDILAENGINHFCDWVNDDMPYEFNTKNGMLTAMPLPTELDDYFIINNNLHSAEDWADQVDDAFEFLLQESKSSGGRVLGLNIHPWVLGQPHRIQYLERVLEKLGSHADVWSTSAVSIANTWKNQQN
ncbi:polysaccharide deacetylase family protein [Costertonia aggregata]|uniref:Polysaccharide deacetylase family protein n=1 Tax=Costertonia aggregata TaxID=343403 RepID=A0A7H9AP63_9FLAO|nr:polysaccharide deacetylase family protein [Costertonia aggregata]QLG45055.1 polysaccharide deacetylase family protein [Costertonia aggregata]